MLNGRIYRVAPSLSAHASRETLIEFCRAYCPDLEMKHARLEDGRLACRARFTLRGREIEIEAVEGDDEVKDAPDALVRRIVWTIRRAYGLSTIEDMKLRRDLEAQIQAAAIAGDTKRADELGLELATRNERRSNRRPVRSKFEI